MKNIYEELQAKILIVEDDDETLVMLQHMLENKNYTLVSSGSEHSIESACTEQPDVILMNLKLKNTTGLFLLKEIKSIPDLQRTPVIMVSEINTPLYWEEAFKRGAAAYLVNPVHLDYLVKRIDKMLKRRQQEITYGSEV
ncbi:response regulator [Saccharicrinis sp. 156]|uniref:response regulator n=1 Tax=Saccharicrinis sp. 156 TaxID=3417574 RepID=UPI003D34B81C